MALGTAALFNALVSHAKASGLFEQVLDFEPKTGPPRALSAAFWAGPLQPIPIASGLNSVTVRFLIHGRLYLMLGAQPEGQIETDMFDALDALMALYCAHFTLGGLVKQIDLLGQHGIPLKAEPGYLRFDKTWYRSATLSIPLIVNNLWTEAP
jgi:hypothetical protein